MMAQMAQSAGCYRYHGKEQRLARRLLMMSDRMRSDELQMTQDSLSRMLGLRREAVNLGSLALQKEKLISSVRGLIRIADRSGLEAAACNCYQTIRDEESSFPVAK